MVIGDGKDKRQAREAGADRQRSAAPVDDAPVQDPVPDLPPTAQRILAAAQRVLMRDGFESLTIRTVGAEAGENSALTRYYFNNKAGLVAALVQSIIYQGSVDLRHRLLAAEQGDQRRKEFFAMQRSWVCDPEEYRAFFALVSHLLSDGDLRRLGRELYGWYRDLESWALADEGMDPSRLTPLATLFGAAADGLALERQVDPGFDPGPAYDELCRMAVARLKEIDKEGH